MWVIRLKFVLNFKQQHWWNLNLFNIIDIFQAIKCNDNVEYITKSNYRSLMECIHFSNSQPVQLYDSIWESIVNEIGSEKMNFDQFKIYASPFAIHSLLTIDF